MITSLAFTETSPPIQLPQIAEGLGAGILINVWVRRTGTGVRQRILDLATADGTHLYVGTGDQADSLTLGVERGTARKEVVALGALPQNRWVKVTARVDSMFGGFGTLEVFDRELMQGSLAMPMKGPFTRFSLAGGEAGQPFVGALSGLEIFRLVTSTSSVSQPVLWARYPLDGTKFSKTVTTADGAVDYYTVDDTSSNNRDGLVAGAPPTLQSATRGGEAVPVLLIPNEFTSVRLSPVQGFSGELTLETWLNPASLATKQTVLSLGDDGDVSLALTVASNPLGDGIMNLMLCRGTQMLSLVEASLREKAGVFQHLAVTVSQGSLTSNKRAPITLTVFVNGQLSTTSLVTTSSVTSGSGSTTAGQEYLPLYWLLNAALIPEVLLGGRVGSLAPFQGQLSEVRIFNTCRSAQEIASTFLSRLVGNEPGLLACYRLEQRIADCVHDISAGHGIGKSPQDGATIYASDGTVIPQDFVIGTATSLPLQHTSNPADAHLNVNGKLVREYLVYDTPTNPTVVQGMDTVFDATLEPVLADGNLLTRGTIQICPDWDAYVYLEQPDHRCTLTLWKAKTTYDVAVPAYGKLRLRFRADMLWFRTLRVRFADMPEGVWTLVRPDSEMHANLGSVTGASLISPSQGKASPLPAGTTAESADVCATVLATIADCYRPSPNSSTFGRTRSVFKNLTKAWNKATDWTEDAISTASSTIQKAGSSAGQFANALVDDGTVALNKASSITKNATALVCHGSTDLTDLIQAAAKAAPRFGTAKLTEAIASADRLAFVSRAPLGELAHCLSIIGTTLINGATYVWRVEASGWANAVRAMSEFLKKIGASVEKMIDFLAWLFNWNDFLRASDTLYNDITAVLAEAPARFREFAQYKEQVKAALTPSGGWPTQSMTQLTGLEVPTKYGAKELEYVLELGQKLMSATDFNLDGLTKLMDDVEGLLPSIDTGPLRSIMEGIEDRVPTALGSPTALLNTPVDKLVAGMLGAPSALIDFLFDAMPGMGDAVIKAISALLTGRISVPHLSGWIESYVLGGRQLNLLRITSLAAAIVQVLAQKIATAANSGPARQQAVSFAGTDAQTGMLWSNLVAGILLTLAEMPLFAMERAEAQSPARAAGTPDPRRKQKLVWTSLAGMLVTLRAVFSGFGNAGLPSDVRAGMYLQATFEAAGGLGMMMFGQFIYQNSTGKEETFLKFLKLVDSLAQSALGILTMGTCCVVGSQKSAFPNTNAWVSYGFQSMGYLTLQASLWTNTIANLTGGEAEEKAVNVAQGLQGLTLSFDIGACITDYLANN